MRKRDPEEEDRGSGRRGPEKEGEEGSRQGYGGGVREGKVGGKSWKDKFGEWVKESRIEGRGVPRVAQGVAIGSVGGLFATY